VVCHPHPLYGGDMRNNVVDALVRALSETGVAAVRFDFRGVGRSGGEHGEGETERLAYRLWRLRRDAQRTRYASLGVPIVEWREGVPMEAVVEEVRAFRRNARVVRA